MKVRTQLVLACFLLSIVPLSGIVLYSYQSSRTALEGAYHREAARLARQMDRRLSSIRNELEQRLAEVSALPLPNLPKGQMASEAVVDDVLLALGESANLVDSIELRPIQVAVTARPSVEAHEPPAPPAEVADAPEPPDPPDPPDPVIIDIPDAPRVPRYRMSDAQRQQIREITRMGNELGAKMGELTPAQRTAMAEQIGARQRELQTELKKSQDEYQVEMKEAQRIRDERRKEIDAQRSARMAAAHPGPMVVETPAPVAAPVIASKVVQIRRALTDAEKAQLKEHEKRIALLFGRKFNVPVRKEGAVVAQLSAQVKPEAVIGRILGTASDDGEIAFAADREGHLYTRTPDDRAVLDRIGISDAISRDRPLPKIENWIISTSKDPQSGLRIGVARPVGENLDDLRRTAAWNFSAGIALILIALIGIVPVANHITRDVKMVTVGAERIAAGDLTTRLPVKSRNEFGQLATAFNKMAHDLSHNHETILQQERIAKEQEMQQRLLELEYGRKSVELEDARRFQLSMLPKEVPEHPGFEVAAFIRTATEVGGDYYDFHLVPDGALTVAVGDATGHGAKAGTMVTVVKTLFSGYDPAVPPSRFLADSAEKIKRMELGRMAMSLLVARFEPRKMTIAAAGMPPALVHRAKSNTIDELAFSATPLGTLGTEYQEQTASLEPGDTILLLTDGFPELLDGAGQQFGYTAVTETFAAAATAASAAEVIAQINGAVAAWHGEQPPNDDVTFVVVRARRPS
ncbi:MAG: Serine phosphatase RsbU, regulator of sigma subunit [Acidobacteria bacterium]|nr:Serine phosphatase RsbU, regulator of sigma subunit [Acidobacteriota bacterium]